MGRRGPAGRGIGEVAVVRVNQGVVRDSLPKYRVALGIVVGESSLVDAMSLVENEAGDNGEEEDEEAKVRFVHIGGNVGETEEAGVIFWIYF